MRKIGILTFHYSNNYGGVLQSLSLQKTLQSLGFNVEVINYIPSNYTPNKIINNLGISKNIFKNSMQDLNVVNIIKKINIMRKYSSTITHKFNLFREEEMKLSIKVDEYSIEKVLNDYDAIIVGSDQVWNPSQRKNPEYFLDFKQKFKGLKISYAADSTIKEIDSSDRIRLTKWLNDFDVISVRNKHSFEFVKDITNEEVTIVADPTVLIDLENSQDSNKTTGEYILTYILGKEISGTHNEALKKIKITYGDLPVYAIKIPTMDFEIPSFADKVFYDLDPNEWLDMFKNASFIYTDSFHGVLFSLKFMRPFLAYYAEKLRATRFIDLGERYKIKRYIVENVEQIDTKKSIEISPDFLTIKKVLDQHKEYSLQFIEQSLNKSFLKE